MSLRRWAEFVGIEARVTQRLKKMPTIIDKLANRETSLNLANMQDIGGCRAIVSGLSDLEKLKTRVLERQGKNVLHQDDYVANPRASGYRAHHIIIETDHGLPIEIQIRTESMHIWATTVEDFSNELEINLKQDGDGPMFHFLKIVADIYWHYETEIPVAPDLISRYTEARAEANDFMEKRKHTLRVQKTSTPGQLQFPIEGE